MRAVIPAGGFGTRMLPATKSMPKEMMPILDKPTIQYVVDEATESGIDELVIVTGRHKRAVEDHFDASPDLEAFLRAAGKDSFLDHLATTRPGTRLFYVRQDRPQGLGHAVLQAAPLVRDGPFVVLLGDDIIVGRTHATRQLMDAHAKTGTSIVAVQRVPRSQVHKYGIVATEPAGHGLLRVTDIVEKPSADNAPSDLAVMGRYLFTPGLIPHLQRTGPGVGGEIQLTDAMKSLLQDEPLYAVLLEGRRFDVGQLEGWLEANLAFAAQRPELRRVLDAARKD
jgi:UTP--glucose-1-phosphate uridylyltransferase